MTQETFKPTVTTILCGQFFDGTDPHGRPNRAIHIAGGVIKDIFAATDFNPNHSEGPVIDLRAYSVLPGLVDTHVHIEKDAETDLPVLENSIAKRAFGAADNVRRALNLGVTTMRVMGTHNFIDVAIRDAINNGWIDGPRLLAAGYLISMTGGHGMELECHSPDLPISSSAIFGGVADGDTEMRKIVRYSIRHGVDLIKFSATGGTLSVGANVAAQQFEESEMRAAVEEANKAGMKTAAHAHGNAGIKAALRAGVSSIEHGSYLDQEAIEMMLERNVPMCPTLYNLNVDLFKSGKRLHLKPHVAERTASLVRALNDSFRMALAAGVYISSGSDSTYVEDRFGLVTELEWFVKLGMRSDAALMAAQAVAGELIGWKDKVGVLKPGAFADVIAVPGDPTADISVLHDTRFVMKGGKVIRDSPRDPTELANAKNYAHSDSMDERL